MPASFATLPSSVLTRILHLYRDPAEKSRDTVKLGCSLARVCSSLDLFGPSLVWCAPILDYSKLDPKKMSIFANFELHGHLHPLVKGIFIFTECCKVDDFPLEVSPIQVTERILQHCTSLKEVNLNLPLRIGSEGPTIFTHLSTLPDLNCARIDSCTIELTPNAIRALLTGFPLATELRLELFLPPGMNTKNLEALGPVQSPIRELDIDLSKDTDPDQVPDLLDVFERAFQLDAIESVRFGKHFLGSVALIWLAFLPNLRHVSLSVDPDELVRALRCILHILHRLPSVMTFTVNRPMSHRTQLKRSLLSSIPISSVLSSIPPSMYIFSFKGIHFHGTLSYPQLRIKRSLLSQTEGPTVQCYFEESVSKQLVRLKKMRDSKGVLRWYQIIEVGSSSFFG
ncbi:hypothetical protein JCM5353_002595 [Sporobolomyces roseus]